MATILITGATSGIGLESAVVLAGMGADLIVVGRDKDRISKALGEIRTRSGVAAASYHCDFASLKAVSRLADDVLRDVPQLDVLINNAGAVFARRRLTVDGFESTFAVNHLSHFLLTTRLLPIIKGRVVTVASGAHRNATIDFGDLQFERGYQIMRAYARAKLANVLFASELARRLEGSGVTSNSMTPGRVATNIWSGAPRWIRPVLTMWVRRRFMPVAAGAAPLVALATNPELAAATGQYFERHRAAPPSNLAQDAALAGRLWDESERLVSLALGR